MIRRAAAATVALAAATSTAIAGCSSTGDYYGRAPYKDDRAIDPSLLRAENSFARALHKGDATGIAQYYTAPLRTFAKSMARFVAEYARYPSGTTGRRPSDDATASQTLAITCSAGRTQTVDIAWAWFDGAWRAWPEDQDTPYPGC